MKQMEYSERLLQVNSTDIIYDYEKTIHQLFEEQVYLDPNRIAARYRNSEITYSQLNEKANQLARLLRNNGIKPNMIVGLMVNRSLEMLIGMLGILKAGGCYLPVDPKFPVSRINHMLYDSGTKILLTQHSIHNIISQISDYSGEVIFLDDDIYKESKNNLDNMNYCKDLAYVIYTSGSTGVPKGVMIEHQSVHNFILGMLDKIDFQKEKKIVSLTTISFDIFVLESLLPLVVGMEIIIADPMTFAQDMQNYRVQMLQTTPSTMQLILSDEKNLIYMDSLTDIMLGGEAFPQRLLKKLKSATKAKIYNMYGPTETTVWSMIKDLSDTDFITVGYPIANTKIFLVDDNYDVVNIGGEGEICIAGDGLSKGYLNRLELTGERFINNKMFSNVKMYRTGDLGKWLENGEVEFLGRIDSQVKIRGFRIELGEIEAAMLKIPGISDCVVSAKTNEDGDKYLVAYYICEKHLIVSDIIAYLKTILPEYEVPGTYMKIDEIPLTPNGKINRLALPDPKTKRPNLNTTLELPTSEKEIEISEIWKNLLRYDIVGIYDNFFDLGGNSILVSQLHVELEKSYHIKIDIADLFLNNTIDSQCMLVNLLNEKIENYILNPIRFPNQFYKTNMTGMLATKLNLTINEQTNKILGSFAQSSDIDLASVYLGLFLFLLSQQCNKNRIQVFCKMNEAHDCILVDLDVSLYSELKDLCRKVSEVMHLSSKRILSDTLKTIVINDDQDVFVTFRFDEVIDNNSVNENEIVLNILETLSDIDISLYFNSNKLNINEMQGFLEKLLQLIELVTADME